MPHISIIVATARNNAIGAKGDLLYHISADLRRFKSITMGHPIIMGRKTFESFPNGPLPGRRNIVITRQKGYNREGVEVTDSLEAAIKTANDADEVMVIGGGEIYREAMGHADRLYLTEIDAKCENADTFFPEIDASQWVVVEAKPWETDARSGVSYRFITLERK